MTHFPVVVLVGGPVDRDTAEDAVAPLLAPFDENVGCEDDGWFAEGSRWDWWVVGGRWTGCLHREPYDPREDPENFVTCSLCNGTGVRPGGLEQFGEEWLKSCNGCNGCHGRGWEVAWELRPYEHDVAFLPDLDPAFIPSAVVTPDGKWHERGRPGWFGTTIEDEQGNGPKPEAVWEATVRALYEQNPEATAVLVDCHV